MRYEVRADIYDQLRCRVALEIDADTAALARTEALDKLRDQYSDSAVICVYAKEIEPCANLNPKTA